MAEQMTPAVEMLWESADPRAALRARFGFPDETTASRWVCGVLEAQWGITVDRCERIVMSDRNALAWLTTPTGRLIAKWSVAPERFARLAALAGLTQWLGERELPVSAPLTALDGRLQVETDGASVGVQRVIAGELLDTSDDALVLAAGAALARLHAALLDYPDAAQVVDLLRPPPSLADRVTGWLDTCPEHVPPAARDALRELVADADRGPLGTQLVHGDVRSANIICNDGAVAAVIDFDEARLDHRIDELARSAVLLGTRYRDWGPVGTEVRERFLAGYQSQHGLTAAEAGWWDPLVLWYSLTVTPAGPDPTGWGSAALDHLDQLRSRRSRLAQG